MGLKERLSLTAHSPTNHPPPPCYASSLYHLRLALSQKLETQPPALLRDPPWGCLGYEGIAIVSIMLMMSMITWWCKGGGAGCLQGVFWRCVYIPLMMKEFQQGGGYMSLWRVVKVSCKMELVALQ